MLLNCVPPIPSSVVIAERVVREDRFTILPSHPCQFRCSCDYSLSRTRSLILTLRLPRISPGFIFRDALPTRFAPAIFEALDHDVNGENHDGGDHGEQQVEQRC